MNKFFFVLFLFVFFTFAYGQQPALIFVNGGIFTMGCTFEQGDYCDKGSGVPPRKVTVNDFYIGKYEVTQKEWLEVMENNPSNFKGCDSCPVEKVNWHEIQEFIKKLNTKTGKKYRLPTDAEWEYAARGGRQSKGYKYSGSNNIADVAWYAGNSNGKTHPVGNKQPNELGIYDMSGNVRERVNAFGDSSNDSYSDSRGGSWYHREQYYQIANRGFISRDVRSPHLGFRLALSP